MRNSKKRVKTTARKRGMNNQLKKLRIEKAKETTITSPRRTIERTMNALDENESEDIELEVKIHFKEPQGNEVDWEFWVDALDSFLEYDNLNDFVQDTDYWHSQTDFLLTGSAFRFNLDRVDLRAPNVILDGEAIRYVDQKIMGGNLITLTDEDSIVSRVKFEMWFSDRDRAQRVLAYVIDSVTPGHPPS